MGKRYRPVAFVKRPRSQAIADGLNAKGARVCRHGHVAICWGHCGVVFTELDSAEMMTWIPMLPRERNIWRRIEQKTRKPWRNRGLRSRERRRVSRGKEWLKRHPWARAILIASAGFYIWSAFAKFGQSSEAVSP